MQHGVSGKGVRFAPSPTGTFHVGNLRTAWIAQWWARALKEPLVARFEDIDKPRVVAGSQESQLADMAKLGVIPDRVYLQSERFERHKNLFEVARSRGDVYPCACSRKEILEAVSQMASAPHGANPIYNGHCRKGLTIDPATYSHPTIAWRFRNIDESGAHDFIVARTTLDGHDFQPGYHWACAIDDYDGQYLLLVRAWDLASAIDYQRAIHAWVARLENARPAPAVFHASLVTRDDGHRLEKRTKGVTLAELDAAEVLRAFEKSFEKPDLKFGKEAVFGEKKREITLAELGIGGRIV